MKDKILCHVFTYFKRKYSNTSFSHINCLKKTTLYDLHKELGGNMVPYAGYELPVFYNHVKGGTIKEHIWCREEGKCSLFDVSHMGQIRWYGKDRASFLERVVVGDIKDLRPNSGILSLITNENGGIIDDTVITNDGSHLYMVVNGATKERDLIHFQTEINNFQGDVIMESLDDRMQLLALQGPGAEKSIRNILPDQFPLHNLKFMTGIYVKLLGIEGCRITRCGYTGEDGFELSIPYQYTIDIASKILEDPNVNVAGLAARDTLRLEAGLCLYGTDLNEDITPTMAALGWTLGKLDSRRRKEGGFLGAQHILNSDGSFKKTIKKRVGITGMKAPARIGTEIYDTTGETLVGMITSGTYSPSMSIPISMGYIDVGSSENGLDILVKIRNKLHKAKVTKMPFIETRYYRG